MADDRTGGNEASPDARSSRRSPAPTPGVAGQQPPPPAFEDPFQPLGARSDELAHAPKAAAGGDVATALIDPFDAVTSRMHRVPDEAVAPLEPLTADPLVPLQVLPTFDAAVTDDAGAAPTAPAAIAVDAPPVPREGAPFADGPGPAEDARSAPDIVPPLPDPVLGVGLPISEAPTPEPPPASPEPAATRPVIDDPLGLGDLGLLRPVAPPGGSPSNPLPDAGAAPAPGTLEPVEVTGLAPGDLELADFAPAVRPSFDPDDEPLASLVAAEIGLEDDPLAPLVEPDALRDLGFDLELDLDSRLDRLDDL